LQKKKNYKKTTHWKSLSPRKEETSGRGHRAGKGRGRPGSREKKNPATSIQPAPPGRPHIQTKFSRPQKHQVRLRYPLNCILFLLSPFTVWRQRSTRCHENGNIQKCERGSEGERESELPSAAARRQLGRHQNWNCLQFDLYPRPPRTYIAHAISARKRDRGALCVVTTSLCAETRPKRRAVGSNPGAV
jgi:hypothetical protein